MLPRMAKSEIALFESFLRCSNNFVEFGTGGSTVLASANVKKTITSVDSSAEWLDKVAAECAAIEGGIQPKLLLVDIGPLGPWGTPSDPDTRDRWPTYHSNVWKEPGAAEADLYLVDGRFRVASFLQILLHATADYMIVFHDFASRKNYHVVGEVADEVARADDLSVFRPRSVKDVAKIRSILARYEHIPH